MSLRILSFESSDPYFNLAFEEALARARGMDLIPDTLRIWRNPRSVILGYFRRIEDDVNISVARKGKLPVIRRFTGGGTVYHDLGCINYSIAVKKEVKFPISYLYEVILKGTIRALEELGAAPYMKNTNDIVVNERKVSGTAASIRWGSLFLHGSILVNANLKALNSVLKPPERIKPSTDPVKYIVANLEEFIGPVTYKDVLQALIRGYSKALFTDVYLDKPSEEEMRIAEILYREKYLREEWNMQLPSRKLAPLEKEVERKIENLLYPSKKPLSAASFKVFR